MLKCILFIFCVWYENDWGFIYVRFLKLIMCLNCMKIRNLEFDVKGFFIIWVVDVVS